MLITCLLVEHYPVVTYVDIKYTLVEYEYKKMSPELYYISNTSALGNYHHYPVNPYGYAKLPRSHQVKCILYFKSPPDLMRTRSTRPTTLSGPYSKVS